jgi:hypothetical protein
VSPSPMSTGQKYVQLALSIDQHVPGYVDAYFGPVEWKAQIDDQGARPVHVLAGEVAELNAAIDDATDMQPQRKDFLARQVKAMHTTLRILQGEKLSLVEEAEGCFDITPTWTDEAVYKDAHQTLEELLPLGGSLSERMALRKKSTEISVVQTEELVPFVMEHLQSLTRARFPIPEEETFEQKFVSNQSWGAYNWYLGHCHSRIEINTDLPLHIVGLPGLTGLLAHEGYPGHHTELANKETKLFQEAGYTEHCLTLINAPSCVVSEGMATCALEVLMSAEEQVAWLSDELLPRAGFGRLDARRELAINKAQRKLAGVLPNAAFLLHEQGVDARGVGDYIQKYGLESEVEARKAVEFLSTPLYRSYAFTYYCGSGMLRTLFEKKGNRDHWYTRLLTEPVTPHQIRRWIEM